MHCSTAGGGRSGSLDDNPDLFAYEAIIIDTSSVAWNHSGHYPDCCGIIF